jgi:hypothetical protein
LRFLAGAGAGEPLDDVPVNQDRLCAVWTFQSRSQVEELTSVVVVGNASITGSQTSEKLNRSIAPHAIT